MSTTIKLSHFYDSGLEPFLDGISELTYNDKQPVNSGEFGDIFPVETIDREPPVRKMLIKLFKPDPNTSEKDRLSTIVDLCEGLRTVLASKSQDSLLMNYPALAGAPLFGFSGINNGTEFYGYVSTDLNEENLQDFEKVLKHVPLSERLGIDLKIRLRCAYRLMAVLALFEKIGFVHADWKPDALFINLHQGRITVIDFECGRVLKKQGDHPWVNGSPREFRAPEVRDFKEPQTQNQYKYVEYWAGLVAVFHIVYGIDPFFFLKNSSNETITDYLANNQWPDLSVNDSAFREEATVLYKYFLQIFRNGEIGIKQLFSSGINAGWSHPEKRPHPNEWMDVLRPDMPKPPPPIIWAQPTERTGRHPIDLHWNTEPGIDYRMLDSNTILPLPPFSLSPSKSQSYTLVAINEFGQTNQANVEVEVKSIIPIIHNIEIENLDPITGKCGLGIRVDHAETVEILLDGQPISTQTNVNEETFTVPVTPKGQQTVEVTATNFAGQSNTRSIRIGPIFDLRKPSEVFQLRSLYPSPESSAIEKM